MTRFPAVGGGGGDQPFMQEDGAETFGESDVTVSPTDAVIVNESIQIGERTTHTVDLSSGDTSTVSGVTYFGVKINPNYTVRNLRATVGNFSSISNGEPVELWDSTQTTIETVSNVDRGESVTFDTDLSADTAYYIVKREPDETTRIKNATFPTGGAFDVTAGYNGDDDPNFLQTFSSIAANGEGGTSGSVYVEWPTPTDIYRWDAATFQSAPDGETVEVHVEESTDSGSTWTTIAGPIDRGQDITAAPDSQVRFRVDLSRENTANNPTLDAIYRRWVV